MILGQRLSGDRDAVAMQQAGIEQRLYDDRDAADLVDVKGHVFAARLEVGDVGRAAHDVAHVLHGEAQTGLVSHRRQMQCGVGRAAGGADEHSRVLQRFHRHDVARPQPALDEGHHRAPALVRPAVAVEVRRRGAGRTGHREPDRLGDHRHRVGGELTAAGAGRGAGDAFERVQVRVRHGASAVPPDRLEHVDHGDVAALVGAGQDRAAIHEHAGDVEADHRHHHPGQRLVAAGEADQRVIAMAAHGELHAESAIRSRDTSDAFMP